MRVTSFYSAVALAALFAFDSNTKTGASAAFKPSAADDLFTQVIAELEAA